MVEYDFTYNYVILEAGGREGLDAKQGSKPVIHEIEAWARVKRQGKSEYITESSQV